MNRLSCIAVALAAALLVTVRAQSPDPKPAFAGQTRQPAPSTLSPALNIETITTRLSGPWSIAFLPDGNFLVTESVGLMRIVRRNGVVSTPIAGVPPVKVVAAQRAARSAPRSGIRAESSALLHVFRAAAR